MAETSTIFGFMKYVSATDILSDFKKTVDSHFVNSLKDDKGHLFFQLFYKVIKKKHNASQKSVVIAYISIKFDIKCK